MHGVERGFAAPPPLLLSVEQEREALSGLCGRDKVAAGDHNVVQVLLVKRAFWSRVKPGPAPARLIVPSGCARPAPICSMRTVWRVRKQRATVPPAISAAVNLGPSHREHVSASLRLLRLLLLLLELKLWGV